MTPAAARGDAVAWRTGALHIHSTYSHDGRDSLERLHAFAVERRLGFLGLTDHAEDMDAARFAEYVAACERASDAHVRLIPGLEFRFQGHTGLHLLVLGLDRWIEPRTPEEFIALAASHAGLTIVAHPILARYDIPESVRGGIDAVEVWNASYNTRYLPDPAAIRVLREIQRERPGVVGIAGLDQHDSRNDRGTRVVLERPGAEPLAEIRAGRFRSAGRTMAFGASVGIGSGAFRLLAVARWTLDRVERVQDRAVRSLRSSG